VLTLQARANAAPADLWLLYDAAVRCRAAGFDYEAYRFALRLSDRLPVERWPAAPVAVLRLFYPPSYDRLVRAEAARADLPPALALALIKQESGFDPRAVSRAGARGLMQLMPATATEQARKEGLRGFDPESLFDPAVNVRLGVAYLRDVLRRQDGNVTFALAQYNAGPVALARWQSRLQGRPLEEVAEEIGYAETREYVKRVSANYLTYQVLWEKVE
jgi:soluble lytic murein transglycosylase